MAARVTFVADTFSHAKPRTGRESARYDDATLQAACASACHARHRSRTHPGQLVPTSGMARSIIQNAARDPIV
jgi:hypothetical protein